jgi:hypothetical protein
LQHLIWTSDILLKTYIHLITFIIVTRSHKQPHPTLQIPRHTRLAPGQFPGLSGQLTGRLLRRVTFPNHIAVPLAATKPDQND